MTFALGFIGCGNMAEAIARAAIAQDTLPAQQIIAADPSAARQAVFSKMGITIAEDNTQVIAQSANRVYNLVENGPLGGNSIRYLIQPQAVGVQVVKAEKCC